MKNIFKKIFIGLVCIFCCTSIFGCSCAKFVDVNYTINVNNSDDSDLNTKILVTSITERKFRAPANTPCYDKNGTLIQDDEGISICYDIEGKKFERATYDLNEKIELEKEYPINAVMKDNNYVYDSNYTSKKYSVSESQYSLIYKFNIKNLENDKIYIREFNREGIIGNIIKENSESKITISFDDNVTVTKNNEDYYEINGNDSIDIVVEVKGLKKKDFISSKNKYLNIKMDIVIYKETIV